MRLRPALGVGALFAISTAAIAVLAVVRPHPVGRPANWSGDDLALLAGWVAAAACALWLTITSLACAIAVIGDDAVRARRAMRWAPPIAGRFVRAVLASALVVAPAPPVTLHVGPDGRIGGAPQPAPAHPRPRPRPTHTTTPAPAPRPMPRVSPPADEPRARSHVVRPGDNLWTIARSELQRVAGRTDDRAVAPYWLRVIAANRATLRSGDPSLIFPGEIVTLPTP